MTIAEAHKWRDEIKRDLERHNTGKPGYGVREKLQVEILILLVEILIVLAEIRDTFSGPRE